MSSIHLTHAHSLSPEQARGALSDLADSLARKLGVESRWDGDSLHFQRNGVDGTIKLLPGQVEIMARLGMFFAPMKGMVEQEIRRVLGEKFG
ncbi:MAG: polyhydroxyalkanoic acid system family protein [Xanthomonadales bacterium]|nr:polyhydroxyalkanoic acid system family protein [Xanthomonadales bacterium]